MKTATYDLVYKILKISREALLDEFKDISDRQKPNPNHTVLGEEDFTSDDFERIHVIARYAKKLEDLLHELNNEYNAYYTTRPEVERRTGDKLSCEVFKG